MTSLKTDNYIRACMKTWLLCQLCITAEADSEDSQESLVSKCRSCASSCFAVVSRLISDPLAIPSMTLACFLDCMECTKECEKYTLEDIRSCGRVCGYCAETLRYLLLAARAN